MGKEKNTNRKILYCIPFLLQVIVHVVASSGILQYATDINNAFWRFVAGVIITGFSLLMGEGYGSLALIVAGLYDHVVSYVIVIILSLIGMCASFVGYTLVGIEGGQCLWMTVVFCCIDLFIIIFSIVRIGRLISKKA